MTASFPFFFLRGMTATFPFPDDELHRIYTAVVIGRAPKPSYLARLSVHPAQTKHKQKLPVTYSLSIDALATLRLAPTTARAVSGGHRATPAAATEHLDQTPAGHHPARLQRPPGLYPRRERGGLERERDGLGADPRRHRARCATPFPHSDSSDLVVHRFFLSVW